MVAVKQKFHLKRQWNEKESLFNILRMFDVLKVSEKELLAYFSSLHSKNNNFDHDGSIFLFRLQPEHDEGFVVFALIVNFRHTNSKKQAEVQSHYDFQFRINFL